MNRQSDERRKRWREKTKGQQNGVEGEQIGGDVRVDTHLALSAHCGKIKGEIVVAPLCSPQIPDQCCSLRLCHAHRPAHAAGRCTLCMRSAGRRGRGRAGLTVRSTVRLRASAQLRVGQGRCRAIVRRGDGGPMRSSSGQARRHPGMQAVDALLALVWETGNEISIRVRIRVGRLRS